MITMYPRLLPLPKTSFWRGPRHNIGIEVKASSRWRSEHGNALRELLAAKVVRRAYAVYLGDTVQLDAGVEVLPAARFAERLPKLIAP
jgi:hypothetical protein